MSIRFTPEPVEPLYRIGRPPDPIAFPPRAFAGGGRFDHPSGDFLVLYAAEQRRGAFVETLDSFRPAIFDLAIASALPDGDPGDQMVPAGVIPDAYFRKLLGRFLPEPGLTWLDLRSPETQQALRSDLAATLVGLGYERRFVWGDMLSHDHWLTQAIAARAFESGHHGIVYSSCHDASLDCWAVFDRAAIQVVGTPVSIGRDDADLVAVARLLSLTIP